MPTNILLCTLGGSWAVVPEVYGFLAPSRLPLYKNHPFVAQLVQARDEYHLAAPDEIWIGTTQGASAQAAVQQVLQWRQLLTAPLVVRIWQAVATDQLASPYECDHMQELLLRMCLLAYEHVGDGQLVLSLAGGRKTMSADLQWAGQIFGCHALIHVVGKEPFPDELRGVDSATMTVALPAALCPHLFPLVAGQSQQSELLALEDGGRIDSSRFPLPVPEPNETAYWSSPKTNKLNHELRRRQRVSGQLLGNFLASLAHSETHGNWRSLYRLPPRVIDKLRATSLGPEFADWIRQLPKADLHRHLGGGLDIAAQRDVGRVVWDAMTAPQRAAAMDTVANLLAEERWPADWPRMLGDEARRAHRAAAILVEAESEQLETNLYGMTEPRVALKETHALGFKAYERPGDLSGSALLVHPAAIEPYARHVVRQALNDGLNYVELRGSPQKYGDGLEFLARFREALNQFVARQAEEITFRFILIVDRRQRDRVGRVVKMAVQAKQEIGDFIAGLDVAGDETSTRPDQLAAEFLPAFETCLPLTIHAGEGEPADSIWQAAYHLHADRIGHGLTISGHRSLASRFRDRGICLELCPTSNREVVGFHDPDIPASTGYGEYPLLELWKAGIPLTVCTDNPGISRTTLTDEYLAAARMTHDGLSLWDTLAILKQAHVHAFLPRDERANQLKHVDKEIYAAVLRRFSES